MGVPMRYGAYFNTPPSDVHLGEAVIVRYRFAGVEGVDDTRWVYAIGNIIERAGRLWVAVHYTTPPSCEIPIEEKWGYIMPYNTKPIWGEGMEDVDIFRGQNIPGYEMEYMLIEEGGA